MIHLYHTTIKLQNPISCQLLIQTQSFFPQTYHKYHLQKLSEGTSSTPFSYQSLSPSSTKTTFFQSPAAYPFSQHSTKHPILHLCYFTPLPHLLLDTNSSYTLLPISLELPREAAGAPLGDIQTGILSSHTLPPPIPTLIKTPTEDPGNLLYTQLYNSIYFIRSSTPHIP